MAWYFDRMNSPQKQSKKHQATVMKPSKSSINRKTHAIPNLRFEDQKLTSFSGLTVFQTLFDHLSLKNSLRACFKHRVVSSIFGEASIVLLLVIHLLLGYRELRHLRFYQDDPMVKRVLGLTKLPDVATISRCLSSMDSESTNNLQCMMSDMVLNRLKQLSLARVTLDFDGSVLGTGRFAEGAAVGFNKSKKGQRSYYPLYCTVAQTGQVFNILHRSGNVHDSNGAQDFIVSCIEQVRLALSGVIVEVRMDSAFFSDALINVLEDNSVEYTISVPFERLLALKTCVEKRRKWCWLDDTSDFFEMRWKPKSWKTKRRFIIVRQATQVQQKQPIQLYLFIPFDYQWEFKIVLTNKQLTPGKAVAYHNGRGSQESIFAELKSCNQMDYIPTKTWEGNKVYMFSAILAHNVSRELQMMSKLPGRSTEEKQPALWQFKKLGTLRKEIIQRAGRIIRPQGKLILSMATNEPVKDDMLHYLEQIRRAA
jgi:hypothetical protein